MFSPEWHLLLFECQIANVLDLRLSPIQEGVEIDFSSVRLPVQYEPRSFNENLLDPHYKECDRPTLY